MQGDSGRRLQNTWDLDALCTETTALYIKSCKRMAYMNAFPCVKLALHWMFSHDKMWEGSQGMSTFAGHCMQFILHILQH